MFAKSVDWTTGIAEIFGQVVPQTGPATQNDRWPNVVYSTETVCDYVFVYRLHAYKFTVYV